MSAFEELGICPEIIQAVEEDDWLLPTPVQQEARQTHRRRPDFGKVMKNVTEEPDGTSIWNIIIVCIYIQYIYIYYIFMDTLRLDTSHILHRLVTFFPNDTHTHACTQS